jgi:hypothetical protein
MSWALLIFDSSRRPEAAFFDRVVLFAITNTSNTQFIAYARTSEAGLGG